MSYWLRPAGTQDREHLLRVYASTREHELDLTDWSQRQRQAFVEMQFEAQQRHYRAQFPRSQCLLIMPDVDSAGGLPVGRLWLDRRADALHVLDISLLPDARGQGLGTRLLRDLMEQTLATALPLTIYVELHNPARRLYERLGFASLGDPQGLYQRMAWQPAGVPRFANEECLR